jgi:adenylate cyclase
MFGRIFKTRYVSPAIGAIVVAVIVALTVLTAIPDRLEMKLLTVHFRLKETFQTRIVQEGVRYQDRNPGISPDIEIIAIDTNSLTQFGRWPWPRWRHADFVNSFTRISNQRNRERAIFLDLFFVEPSENAFDDAILIDAIDRSGRVFLETVLTDEPVRPAAEEEFFRRHEVLFNRAGEIRNVQGKWWEMQPYYGVEPPLQPYGRAAAGYGHANFSSDWDSVFRRQPLVAKVSRLVGTTRLDDLALQPAIDPSAYERLAWIDRDGRHHRVDYPLTEESLAELREAMEERAPLALVDTTGDGLPNEEHYVVRAYRDQFIPSVTLSLALAYFNRSLNDLEIVLGSHIIIPDVRVYNPATNEWEPYFVPTRPPRVDADGRVVREGQHRLVRDIVIPINNNGEMLINFMGPRSSPARDGYQTFPVRSYAAYTAGGIVGADRATWRPTRAAENKILMVGLFAPGMADDELPTPHGLMYGVEIHANALNTIIMDRFLREAPVWANIVLLAVMTIAVATATGRLRNPFVSFACMICAVLGLLLVVTFVFDTWRFVLNFSSAAIGMVFAFVGVVAYRVLTEGRERRFITNAFGTYVSPAVVQQLVRNPALLEQLGGERRELTMFFSDIEGFTTLSESLPPDVLVSFLKRYLTELVDIIQEESGTIDKFEGDAIIAFWNAPLDVEDHAVRAVRAALRCQKRLVELQESFERPVSDGGIGHSVHTRMGLHTGQVNVGNFGSDKRLDYTALGDGMNLASRLEGSNKEFGTYCLISQTTYRKLHGAFPARELGRISVVGRHEPVTVYEPMLPEDYETRKKVIDAYERGLEAWYNARLHEARKSFRSICRIDPPAARMISQIDQLLGQPPDERPRGWSGVLVRAEK